MLGSLTSHEIAPCFLFKWRLFLRPVIAKSPNPSKTHFLQLEGYKCGQKALQKSVIMLALRESYKLITGIYTYIYIHIHTYIHTYIHTHSYAHTHTHTHVCVYVCVWWCTYVKGQLSELVLAIYHVGSGDWPQVNRFGSGHLYPLSHFTDLLIYFASILMSVCVLLWHLIWQNRNIPDFKGSPEPTICSLVILHPLNLIFDYRTKSFSFMENLILLTGKVITNALEHRGVAPMGTSFLHPWLSFSCRRDSFSVLLDPGHCTLQFA
jgi:hypothetical protein